VAGYLDGGQERFAALWVKGGEEAEALPAGPVPARWERADRGQYDPLVARASAPDGRHRVTLQVFVGRDGQVRYSSIWQQAGPWGRLRWLDGEETYRDWVLSGGLPVDVCLSDNWQYLDDARTELLAWLAGSPPWVGLAWHSQHPMRAHPERNYAGCFLLTAAM